MTKKEAIKQLISDFVNKQIANNWENQDETDKEIIKALKIKPKKL